MGHTTTGVASPSARDPPPWGKDRLVVGPGTSPVVLEQHDVVCLRIAYTKLGCFPVVLQQSSLEYACSSCICTAGFAGPNLEQTRCAAAGDRWQPQWSQQQCAPSCPSCCGDIFAPARQPVRARGGCTQQPRSRRRGDSGQQQPQCSHLASCGWSEPAAGCRQARGCT